MSLYLKHDPAVIRTKGRMNERLLDAIDNWFERRKRRTLIFGGWYNMLAAHDSTFSTYKLERNRRKMLEVLAVMQAVRKEHARRRMHDRSRLRRLAATAAITALKGIRWGGL